MGEAKRRGNKRSDTALALDKDARSEKGRKELVEISLKERGRRNR